MEFTLLKIMAKDTLERLYKNRSEASSDYYSYGTGNSLGPSLLAYELKGSNKRLFNERINRISNYSIEPKSSKRVKYSKGIYFREGYKNYPSRSNPEREYFVEVENLSHLPLHHTFNHLSRRLLQKEGDHQRANVMMMSEGDNWYSSGSEMNFGHGLVMAEGGNSIKVKRNVPHNLKPNSLVNFTWPNKKVCQAEGDIVLGGLMMIHEREEQLVCGMVMPQGGVQALEVMLFTIDYVNNGDLLPGFKLGYYILDDCDKDTYGLEQSVDFIKGSISSLDEKEYKCADGSVPEGSQMKIISGVVGAPSSVTSIQVANLLRLFKIPQISFFSTTPELSNKERFEYFSRTVPSDEYQALAMIELIKLFNWSYISVIYEESNYGERAFTVIEEQLDRHNICIAVKEKLTKDSGVARENQYDIIVRKLLHKSNAKGVIIYGSDQEVGMLMAAVGRQKATGKFMWIGSDGWSARDVVTQGRETDVEGTVSVQPLANPIAGFTKYFANLTVKNNPRDPWFSEVWETYFKCRYPGTDKTFENQAVNPEWAKNPCTGNENLNDIPGGVKMEDQLQFVSDAVLAYAYAFRDMHKDFCNGVPGLCDRMNPPTGPDTLEYIRKVKFTGLSGDDFEFLPNGDGPPRYNIIHFKQVSPGVYEWVNIGVYVDKVLNVDMNKFQYRIDRPKVPESVCSKPCLRGQAKKIQGDRCCWICVNCTAFQILPDDMNCVDCELGYLPNQYLNQCLPIPEIYLSYSSPLAIGAICFSFLGIVCTLFVLVVFIKFSATPVVKASGRELSFALLIGILMCYAVTFLLVARPSNVLCGMTFVAVGTAFALCYAAILTKTNRIARIFNSGKRSSKRPTLISPQSQIMICTGLVGVQVAIMAIKMIMSPPRATYNYPIRTISQLVCVHSLDFSYLICLGYPLLLIAVCTVYAIMTRKIPEAFNESKYIGFTMYTTCIIWLAFLPIYIITANNIPLRITTLSVSMCLSATTALVCLFTPKLYIILLHPERNIKQSMMTGKTVSGGAGTKAGGPGSGGGGGTGGGIMSNTNTTSSYRIDSGTQSDDLELTNKLRPAGSLTSNSSKSSTGTQTIGNGIDLSNSRQTLYSIGAESLLQGDVQL